MTLLAVPSSRRSMSRGRSPQALRTASALARCSCCCLLLSTDLTFTRSFHVIISLSEENTPDSWNLSVLLLASAMTFMLTLTWILGVSMRVTPLLDSIYLSTAPQIHDPNSAIVHLVSSFLATSSLNTFCWCFALLSLTAFYFIWLSLLTCSGVKMTDCYHSISSPASR